VKFLDRIHGIHEKQVVARRTRVLGSRIAAELPPAVSILDVGCGDGALASRIQKLRPDIRIRGIDTLIRESSGVAVESFDGRRIPYAGGSFDLVLRVDVIHHAEDPTALPQESARVSRRWIVIKDHLEQGWLATSTLRFMHRAGNARHGVALTARRWGH